ncbi:rhodanese-related sulfurtransferase [Saccharicrinis aurantiacus]|uniref:oxygen-dependent tRNA uridine(34) hydroxylase TrhO n=1 Tax=Saccharicrinis aurantiacus TaxID=1849719 RepID=UPI0024909EC4|nr:rhodanese-related sulfurtransferase [Saccharicrinis aurantiacus]
MHYNKLNKEQLIHKIETETFNRITISFYKYVSIDNPENLRDELFIKWNELLCLGRIYIAEEGINAQMSIPEYNIDTFKNLLNSYKEFKDIPFKIGVEQSQSSFYKLQIKVRKQIVADNLDKGEYDVTNVGKHLNAKEWNDAMDKGATIVDMRNFYESEIGHFKNAILPDAETFSEELPMVLNQLKGKEDEKVLLYCTGGVRCEKTSAYLRNFGFKDVNQLHGGIIDYAKQIKEQNLPNKFIGKNFVFDNRLAEKITDDVISKCHQCGDACNTHINCSNVRCNILLIQCPKCAKKYSDACSEKCMEYVLADAQKKAELDKLHNYRPIKRYFKSTSKI